MLDIPRDALPSRPGPCLKCHADELRVYDSRLCRECYDAVMSDGLTRSRKGNMPASAQRKSDARDIVARVLLHGSLSLTDAVALVGRERADEAVEAAIAAGWVEEEDETLIPGRVIPPTKLPVAARVAILVRHIQQHGPVTTAQSAEVMGYKAVNATALTKGRRSGAIVSRDGLIDVPHRDQRPDPVERARQLAIVVHQRGRVHPAEVVDLLKLSRRTTTRTAALAAAQGWITVNTRLGYLPGNTPPVAA